MNNCDERTMFLEGPSTLVNERGRTLRELLLDLFHRSKGEDICGILGDDRLTIEMLRKDAEKVSLKMQNECCVGICMDLSLELIILLCGLILCGVRYVPLEPQLPEERLAYILQDSQPSILITTNENILSHSNRNIPMITFHQLINQKNIQEENLPIDREKEEEEEIFCIMYTSGSTGRPKGVRLPNRALLNRLNWQWRMFPFSMNEMCCLKTSISFVDSICELFAPLLRGIPLIVIPRSLLLDMKQLIEVFNNHCLTRLILVPSLLNVLLEYFSIEKKQIETLRFVICSGENLSPDLVRRFFQISPKNCQLLNLYGSTEVMGDVTFEVFSSSDDLNCKSLQGRTSIGKPIDNMRIDILNPDDQHIGELFVSGQGVASDYHHGQLMEGKFLPDPNHPGRFNFRTGDIGRIWNGNIILFGRTDNQVKIAGNRVNLNEIEFQLKNHCNCKEPIALLVNDEIVVFILENEKERNLDRNSLAEYLPRYAIPSAFIRIPHFPLLVSGKIDRHQLFKIAKEKVSFESKEEEISCETIEMFSHALEEVGICRSNIDQNFFAAGGSSLNALLLVAKLHAKGFSTLTVERLITAPSLRHIELDLFKEKNQTEKYFDEQIQHENHFTFIPLQQVDKEIALQILTESFLTYGEIDTLIHQHRPQLKEQFRNEWANLMNSNWNTYLTSQLSFGVIDHNSRLIGLSLSYDINSPPTPQISTNQIELLTPLNALIDIPLLHRIEQLITDEHLSKIMRSHVTTVQPDLTPAQRLTTMYFIEKHLLHIAKLNNYQAVITANTSSVTQQLAEHVLKYDTHHITPANQAIYPNTLNLIFPNAPNHYSVTISVKYI